MLINIHIHGNRIFTCIYHATLLFLDSHPVFRLNVCWMRMSFVRMPVSRLALGEQESGSAVHSPSAWMVVVVFITLPGRNKDTDGDG